MTKRVCVIGEDFYVDSMFEEHGWEVISEFMISTADLVCFTGGADVHPSFYGHSKHPTSRCDVLRDNEEVEIWEEFVNNISMVGICRGGQLLNVLNGGALCQHIEGHTQSHPIVLTDTGRELMVTSTHHQLMLPSSLGKVLAYSPHEVAAAVYNGERFTKETLSDTAEVVLYGSSLNLCFQPHPEYPNHPECTEYFFQCVDKYLV